MPIDSNYILGLVVSLSWAFPSSICRMSFMISNVIFFHRLKKKKLEFPGGDKVVFCQRGTVRIGTLPVCTHTAFFLIPSLGTGTPGSKQASLSSCSRR